LARPANGQAVRAPTAGGRIASLGQPALRHWQFGFASGAYLRGSANDVMLRAGGGVYYAPLNPVAKLAELGFETYFGARGNRADVGARAIFQIPYFSTGVGADFNFTGKRVDMMITAHTPVRRGGLLTRGSLLRIDWYPTLGHSFLVGVTVPLWDRLAGRNRPIQDYVEVTRDFYTPEIPRTTTAALNAALDSLAASADWIRRVVVPFLDQDGRNDRVALQRTSRYLAGLQAHLSVRSALDEVRYFHAQLQHTFTVAAGDSAAGAALARQCRAILLDQIILPYNRLLGRKKRHDTLREFSMGARGQFSRWIAASGIVPATRMGEVTFAFQRVTELLDELRGRAAKEWDDPRLVWLPLQYALLPEEYDEQAELNTLMERATAVPFTDGNRLSYVANLQFHWELLRMIRETRDYHVLWIHDFPAFTKGTLDGASLAQVVDGYLSTLAKRVEMYDSVGTLPSYFILLDQHYYEGRKSRILMTLLEDPLRASGRLEGASETEVTRVTGALARLRAAVQHSRVLQAEALQYGEPWLHNRIKVHVNITNRVDASFWGGGLVSSVFGYPDDVMRDHRKVAFRDVREGDPYRGVGILTGMGVGENYLGPGWDDRSLVLQGPVLLQLREAARELLLTQGLVDADLPEPLRSRPAVAGDDVLRAPADAARFDTHAMALVNGTGYLPKPLNVAKALLYSLMPPGSVLKIPDSLWNATFYASLLVGACLRGADVLVIAPALTNAPSSGFPQMARAHELLSRLLLVRRELAAAIAAAGGDLRTGLYALPLDERGFSSRVDLWARQLRTTPFLQALLPFAPPLSTDSSRVAAGGSPEDPTAPPKLHQKVQFLATREFWRGISASPEWPQFMATYLRYRAATYSRTSTDTAVHGLPDSLAMIAERLLGAVRDTPRAASFAMVGSQNQDYRGMFMDGEVGVLFTGAESLVPLVDLVFMVGTVTWVDDQATLNRLLPPVGELKRRIARIAKDGV
jgi:hypothetical protein